MNKNPIVVCVGECSSVAGSIEYIDKCYFEVPLVNQLVLAMNLDADKYELVTVPCNMYKSPRSIAQYDLLGIYNSSAFDNQGLPTRVSINKFFKFEDGCWKEIGEETYKFIRAYDKEQVYVNDLKETFRLPVLIDLIQERGI